MTRTSVATYSRPVAALRRDPLDVLRRRALRHVLRRDAADEGVAAIHVEDEHADPAVFHVVADAGFRHVEIVTRGGGRGRPAIRPTRSRSRAARTAKGYAGSRVTSHMNVPVRSSLANTSRTSCQESTRG